MSPISSSSSCSADAVLDCPELKSTSSGSPYLRAVAEIFEQVASRGGGCEASGRTTIYDSLAPQPPEVSLHDYLRRWARHTRCGAAAVLCAVVYVDRVCVRGTSAVSVTRRSVHRLLLAALTVASKWYTDAPFLNSHYAAVGGVPLLELNKLEAALLNDIGWAPHVSGKELATYAAEFRRHASWRVTAAAAREAANPSLSPPEQLEASSHVHAPSAPPLQPVWLPPPPPQPVLSMPLPTAPPLPPTLPTVPTAPTAVPTTLSHRLRRRGSAPPAACCGVRALLRSRPAAPYVRCLCSVGDIRRGDASQLPVPLSARRD